VGETGESAWATRGEGGSLLGLGFESARVAVVGVGPPRKRGMHVCSVPERPCDSALLRILQRRAPRSRAPPFASSHIGMHRIAVILPPLHLFP
jgi:hypothetical protein